MIAHYLADKLTPLVPVQAIAALRSAFETVEGVTPSPECLSIHTAQSALECWRWKSLRNFNLANVKASATYQGHYQTYKCNEKIDNVWRFFIPEGELVGDFTTELKGAPLPVPEGHPQTRFRAFQNAEAGALDHMQLVKRKWPEAWTAARGGDRAGFVHGLKMRAFFTADEAPYFKAVNSLATEFLPLCRSFTATVPEPAPGDHEMRCAALACVAPDPDRYLHTEAVIAAMNSMGGVWDAIREERNAALRES